MLISDGGGYGGTNWTGMDVVQMWQAIANQDTTAHYQLLTGWRKSYELTLEHLGQVQNYRQSLAEAWPPETSAASAAYLQRLDNLIVNLQATYDAAVANHDAFANATLAISMSRDDVKKIYDEYTVNQAKLEEFKSQPRPISKSPIPPQKPPVPDGRQEELNNQARTIMFGLSGEIIQAKTQIVKPSLYDPADGRSGGRGEDGGRSLAAPPIPPIATYDPSAASVATVPANSAQHQAIGVSPNLRTEPVTKPQNGVLQPGLVLGGIQPNLNVQTPINSGVTPTLPAGTIVPNLIRSSSILGMPSAYSSPTWVSPITPGMKPFATGDPSSPGGTIGGSPEAGAHAMPSGAVIGGTPGAGPRSPAAGRRSAVRVNPVGGVIEPRTTQQRSGSTTPSTRMNSMANLGGHPSNRREESAAVKHWDPDNPWATADGVPPVLVPPFEQRIDPGPAIGLR